MKLKLQRVIERLPETKNNITKAAKLEGYSKSYAETLIHKTIRKYIGVKSEDDIKEEFLIGLDKDIKRFKKEKDNSNYMRTKELKSKLLGLQIDKSESKVTLNESDRFQADNLINRLGNAVVSN